MKDFDWQRINLSGLNLIEASAGTGKTFSISHLVLRILLETNTPIAQILVITFTRAATADLQQRIRETLIDARTVLCGTSNKPDLASYFATRTNNKDTDLATLYRALMDFDEAAVFTLDAFAKKTLSEYAFEAGMPMNLDVDPQEHLLTNLAHEFYQRQLVILNSSNLPFSPVPTNQLLQSAIKQSIASPLINLPKTSAPDKEELSMLQGQFHEASCALQTSFDAQQIKNILLTHKDYLNRTKMNLAFWLNLEGLLQDLSYRIKHQRLRINDPLPPLLIKLTLTYLNQALKKGCDADFDCLAFKHLDSLWLASTAYDELQKQFTQQTIIAFIQYARAEILTQSIETGQFSFSSLNRALFDALQDPEHQSLLAQIANDYPFALVDEAQDTDGLQMSIIRKLYPENSSQTLFMVGDPKQSIYRFRGADIHAYLQARKHLSTQYRLTDNYRSRKALLDGINQLFSRIDKPFYTEAMCYTPVNEGKPQAAFNAGFDHANQYVLLEPPTDKPAIDDLYATVFQRLGHDIKQLLSQGLINENKLRPKDICILVSNNAQVLAIADYLTNLGLPIKTSTQRNIYTSVQAIDLLAHLKAIANPKDPNCLMMALANSLHLSDGHDLLNDTELLIQSRQHFMQTQLLFNTHGASSALGYWIRAFDIETKQLSLHGGLRRITNIKHLIELLVIESQRKQLGLSGLIDFLDQQIANEENRQDAHLIRLDSDDERIAVMTVHQSKGLDFPVVICPLLFVDDIGRLQKPTLLDAHNDRHLILSGSEHDEALRGEALAERLRLIYVALTRAKYQNLIYLSPLNLPRTSKSHIPKYPLLYLMGLENFNADALKHAGFSFIHEHTEPPALFAAPPSVAKNARLLHARTFTAFAQLHPWVRAGSFSSLTRDFHVSLTEPHPPPLDATPSLLSFPRGVQTGLLIHEILELTDFSSPQSLCEQINLTAQKYGLNQTLTKVLIQVLPTILQTPLFDDAALADIPSTRCLKEMHFHLFSLVSLDGLKHVLQKAQFIDSPEKQAMLDALSFEKLNGILSGFIDLIVQHNGQYYVIDYKSNYLGSTAIDYNQSTLEKAMAEHAYHLQYLIYTLALHRLLKQRLPNYDYDTHIGGVRYTFIRGMPASGVYATRPSKTLIQALDNSFMA